MVMGIRRNELFFKWVKQHLKIKKFWGDSENAVRIQINTGDVDRGSR